MATSTRQKNTTIDAETHAWYKQIANNNPLFTMMSMMRQAHAIYMQNHHLLHQVQRRLQDNKIYLTDAELIGKLLRMVIYKKIDLTTVDEKPTVVR